MRKFWLINPILLGLVACASIDTSYGSLGGEEKRAYGYSEVQKEDGSYILTVKFPAASDGQSTIQDFWDKRAEELCDSEDYTKNIYATNHPTVLYDTYGGRPSGVLQMTGFLSCSTRQSDGVNQSQDETQS